MLRYFRALYHHRELLYFLALREIKAKYKQSVLGISWAVLQPLSMMVVMTVVFSVFARLPSNGVPYAIFAFCALLPWTFFSGTLGRSTGSLLSNQSLVKKVYFPREILVLAVVASALVDLAIGCLLFTGLLWYFHIPLTAYALLALPIFLIQLCFVLGVAFILSPLNVFYRDVGHVIPLLTQIWMFASPIVYPMSMVPPHLRTVYSLNPMAGVIDGYRRTILHGAMPDPSSVLLAAAIAMATFSVGFLYFKRVEFRLADVL